MKKNFLRWENAKYRTVVSSGREEHTVASMFENVLDLRLGGGFIMLIYYNVKLLFTTYLC